MMEKTKAIFVMQPKGGCGKTTVTEIVTTIYESSGKKALVVDVDDGNSAFTRRAGPNSAIQLSWMTTPDRATGWIDEHLEGQEFVCFDLGANLSVSGTPVTQFLGAVVNHLREKGAQLHFFAIDPTNSPGCGQLVATINNDLGALGEVHIVQNNVDGSGCFSTSLDTIGIPAICVPHFDAGIQAARLLTPAPLLKLLENPPQGYELAMAHYAQKLLELAVQDNFKKIIGDCDLSKLQALAADAPRGLYFMVQTLRAASNSAIRANAEYRRALDALCSADFGNRDAACSKARDFVAAYAKFHAV